MLHWRRRVRIYTTSCNHKSNEISFLAYIEPFLAQISDISNYTVRTQWKYRVSIEADLKQVRDQSKLGRHYALQESALPHLLTSIAQNLSASITDKPVINLVVYIPPCNTAPLHIYNNANEMLTRNGVDAFISPPWGGFIIANPPELHQIY